MPCSAVEADRALGEADDRPGPVAGIEPGFEPLLALGALAVAEVEAQADGARGGGRLELDIGDAVLALDPPERARALEPGELARLLGVGLDRRIIRRGHLEIAGQAVPDRAAVAVGQADGEHRPGDAVGDQHRAVAQQLGAHRAAAITDRPAQRLGQAAVGVAHFGGELGRAGPRAGCRATG